MLTYPDVPQNVLLSYIFLFRIGIEYGRAVGVIYVHILKLMFLAVSEAVAHTHCNHIIVNTWAVVCDSVRESVLHEYCFLWCLHKRIIGI